MEKFEIVKKAGEFNNKLIDFKKIIKLPELSHNISVHEQTMLASDFWLDSSKAQSIIEEVNKLKNTVSEYQELSDLVEELDLIINLNDESYFNEAANLIDLIEQKSLDFETKLLLNDEYDSLNAFVELHPGAGGTESQDWAQMLYRMYKRFCERHKWTFELLDYQEALDAGLKSVTFLVKGRNAYGTLKSERGVHRLVRISPFDSNSRRHTSFAACNVTPEIKSFKDYDMEISPEDIRIDTYRSGGAGGQHVNTTDSAVRITHIASGIVVSCQNERSQIQNKEQAMSILKSKLYELKRAEHENKLKNITGSLGDNAFGNQIRSYVLHPYALVKDHRTNYEASNPDNVLDGDLDGFINAYLKKLATGRK